MKISFIQPSRDNLKYLQWSYNSIRKNQGNHEVEICVADDFSSDGTLEWCKETEREDPHFKFIRNDGPTRAGHTILYDRLINEVATHDICIIFHADMYLCPGALDAIEKHIKPRAIVSLTRIEPELHGSGPEKVLFKEGGVEPEHFNESALLSFVASRPPKDCTNGIFAPWAFYKKDFQENGGHDPLYAPQSKEDSDIFNRFALNKIHMLQTWEGYVYHMTCRGSRFNPSLTKVGQNSSEWEAQNRRSLRNFIRKWGSPVKHTELLNPIVLPKYQTLLLLKNASPKALMDLEPHFSLIAVDVDYKAYIEEEQPNTLFNLRERIFSLNSLPPSSLSGGIVITGDVSTLTGDDVNVLKNFNELIYNHGPPCPSAFKVGNLDVKISSLESNEYDLVKCER
jgi:glycosyltransferase involved in cell wall biosynthesis